MDKWGLGPSIVGLTIQGPWVVGSLFSQVWSTGGSGDEDVSLFTWQYFVNYNFPGGLYLTSSPIITANWNNPKNKGWTVPVGAGFGRVFVVGKQPINASLSAYYNVVKPEVGGQTLLGDWTIRAQVQFLFPKRG